MIISEKSLPEKFYLFCLHVWLETKSLRLKVNTHLQLSYTAKRYSENVCKSTWPTIIHRTQDDVGCRVKYWINLPHDKIFFDFFLHYKKYSARIGFFKSLNSRLLMIFPNIHSIDTRTSAMLSLKSFCCCVRYSPLTHACEYHLKGYAGSPYIQSLSCWVPKEKFSSTGISPDILNIVTSWRLPSTGTYNWYFWDMLSFVTIVNYPLMFSWSRYWGNCAINETLGII